jgi:predicted RNase H-like HicB family nuclease
MEYLSNRNNVVKMQTFTAVLYKEEDMCVAECPEVGTASQGETLEEAINNLKEATELYLEEFPLEEKKKSIITTFEAASVAKA